MKSAYNQMSLLASRTPIEKALQDPTLSEEEKRKLRLAQEVRLFCENDLGLKKNKSYQTFVKLDRPYVTYVVNASPKWELKNYEWSYPLVGKMPYKGYFNEADAKEEAQNLKEKDLDVYLRGVAAYSTLGWFNDPLLSSMLRYQDYDLVDTIIHETVHANLYIKNNADFNERLAVFLGAKGMEMFYLKLEGPDSPTLKKLRQDQQDQMEFSKFISEEVKALRLYYKNLPDSERNESERQKRLDAIKENFRLQLSQKLITPNYKDFPNKPLNNARLLLFSTYIDKLSDFQKLWEQSGSQFQEFMKRMKSLENSSDPQRELAEIANSTKP